MKNAPIKKQRSNVRKTANHQSSKPKSWHPIHKNALHSRQITGRISENLVIWYLKMRGWTIRTRNYTSKHGEIDIIASRYHADLHGCPTVAFIEVKSSTHANGLAPELSVSRTKRKRINATIRDWIGEHPREKAVYRRDIASIRIVRRKLPSIHYIPSAFTNDDPFGW